jgi:hypothetical protein
VLLIRRIRDLLYDQGFTISGARNRLSDAAAAMAVEMAVEGAANEAGAPLASAAAQANSAHAELRVHVLPTNPTPSQVRDELLAIRELLGA